MIQDRKAEYVSKLSIYKPSDWIDIVVAFMEREAHKIPYKQMMITCRFLVGVLMF